jgi:O-antigen/teichoic acid export membrane protein
LPSFFSKEIAYRRDDPAGSSLIHGEFFTSVIYGTGLTVLIGTGVVVFYQQIPSVYIILSFAAGYFLGIEMNLYGFLLGTENMKSDALFNGMSFGFSVILIGVFHPSGLDLIEILFFRLGLFLFGVLARFIYMKKNFIWSGISSRLRYLKEEKYYFFSYACFIILRQVDVLVLSYFISTNLLGSYFLSVRIYMTVALLLEVVSSSLSPFISRSFQGREDISFGIFLKRLVAIFFGMGILMGVFLFVFGDFLVGLFDKQMVDVCSPYLKLLALVVPFRCVNTIWGSIFSSSRFQNIRFYIITVTAAVYLVGTVVFVYFWQDVGAIFARIVSDLILFFISIYFGFRKFDRTVPE